MWRNKWGCTERAILAFRALSDNQPLNDADAGAAHAYRDKGAPAACNKQDIMFQIPPLSEIVLKTFAGAYAEGDHSGLPALSSLDPDEPGFQIDVLDPKLHQLAHSHSSVVEELEDEPVPHAHEGAPIWLGDQGSDLLRGERLNVHAFGRQTPDRVG